MFTCSQNNIPIVIVFCFYCSSILSLLLLHFDLARCLNVAKKTLLLLNRHTHIRGVRKEHAIQNILLLRIAFHTHIRGGGKNIVIILAGVYVACPLAQNWTGEEIDAWPTWCSLYCATCFQWRWRVRLCACDSDGDGAL
jgi:hypothetical protein